MNEYVEFLFFSFFLSIALSLSLSLSLYLVIPQQSGPTCFFCGGKRGGGKKEASCSLARW